MALNVAVTTATPELPAPQFSPVLVQPLAAQSQFLAAGPRIFDTAGPLRIPKMADPTDPSWHGESEPITEVNPDFDEVALLPSTMKSIKTLTRYSNELARQSVVSLDAALRDRLVTDVAAKLDTQLFSASGDGTTMPKGLFAYSGIQTLAVGGAITLDALLDAWALAMAANVNTGSLKWVMRSREFIKLRKLKDSQNRYQLQPDPTQDGVFRLFGAPVVITNRVPDTTGGTPTARIGLVDFSQVGVGGDLAPP